MPWKMVFFLIVLAFVVFFAGFNISNTSDISFGFYTIQSVPIFISLFVAFLIGAFVMIPFMTRGKNKGKSRIERQEKRGKIRQEIQDDEIAPDIPPVPMEELPTEIPELENESKKKKK